MREPTLVKNLTNVKPVASVSAKQEISGIMRDPTLVERLTNVKPVKMIVLWLVRSIGQTWKIPHELQASQIRALYKKFGNPNTADKI